MSNNLLVMTTARAPKRSATTIRTLRPTPQDFDVGVGGVVEVTVGTITATQDIEVKFNGAEKREGEGHDFTRDTANGKILFNYNVPQNTWIRVRLYPE